MTIFLMLDKNGSKFKGFNDINDANFNKDKGWIRCESFAFGGEVAHADAHSSGSHQVSGRTYQPGKVRHLLSSTAALAHQAMVQNTDLEITVAMTRPVKKSGGTEEHAYLTYKFIGANICSQKVFADDSPGKAYMEELEFTCAQVQISADDDHTGEKTESEDKARLTK